MAEMRFPAASDPGSLPADEQLAVDATPAAASSGPPEVSAQPELQAYAGETPPPGDWLERVCPYLLSEDGTWRSTQPDLGHRCMAQEPPGELPPMFQERFCLSDRHVRCEWYKDAQASRSAAPEGDGADQPEGAHLSPSARSTSLMLGSSDGGPDAAGGGSRRPPRALLIALGLVGGFVVLVLIALLLGSRGGDGASNADGSPAATATTTAVPTTRPTRAPTPEPTTSPTADPAASGEPSAADVLILYEVQPGERLEAIAAHFDIKRRRIIRANEGMADAVPQVEAGQEVFIPVPATMSTEEISSLAGFLEFVEAPET